MCVIHHHVEWLAFVDLLEAARHSLQIANAGFDARRGNIESDGSADRRENVVNVDATHECRTRFDIARWRYSGKLQSVKAERKFLGGDLRRAAQAIGDRAMAAFRKLFDEPLSVSIVGVDDRCLGRACAGAFEK